MITTTTSQAFFDELYRRDSDPWNFASSEYELGRYSSILHVLPPVRFKRAFEPGCSVGILTERLASLCDAVDAMDISPIAVERARQRCSKYGNVKIQCAALPGDLPTGKFDLMVFSEIGYYFAEPQLQSLVNELVLRLEHGAIFIAAHWLGSSRDHLLSGDQVHESLLSVDELVLEHSERHTGFRLDRWRRR